MNLSHYFSLIPSYLLAVTIGLIYYKKIQTLFINSPADKGNDIYFKKPWLELLFAFIAAITTLLIGQLYMGNYLIPKNENFNFFIESINQVIIFSPFIILLWVRGQSIETAFLPKRGKLKSILVGFGLALIAILSYGVLSGTDDLFQKIFEVYHYKNLDKLVQVFLEDFAIAVILFRLLRITGPNWGVFIVAILFASAHIPALVTNGFQTSEMMGLVLDTILGVMVLRAIYSTQNFLWFWMVHYALDMTQYF